MTPEEKRNYVEAMCDAQKKVLLDRLDRVPEHWDGVELRNWFVDVASQGFRHPMGTKRNRDYRNDIITLDL